MIHKLDVLSRIAERLNEDGITWAVGASLLLYVKGMTDTFHDIDIMTTEADAERLKSALLPMGEMQPPHPNRQYQTRHFDEFVIDGVDVDVMAGFVIVRDAKAYECPFTRDSIAESVSVNGQRIPLQSVSDWRRYYDLMGRAEKVAMIDRAANRSTGILQASVRDRANGAGIDH